MTTLHIVTGDKGNVGKSAWCSAMIEYYRFYETPLELVDADGDSQTLSKTHKEAFPIVLSEDRAYATFIDSIYEITYGEIQKKDKGGDVLVDLPAGGEKFINKWLDECSIVERARKDGVDIFKWWVSDSDAHSIQLFEEDVAKYPSITHIFLKNMGRSAKPQWVGFDKKKKIQSLIKSGKITLLEIPDLTSAIIDDLRASKARLSDVLADDEFKVYGLSKNMRVSGWVDTTRSLISPLIPIEKMNATVKTAA